MMTANSGGNMKNRRRLISFGGLIAMAAAASIVALNGQAPAPVPAGDFRNAAVAQVRNAQGLVVLQGQFEPPVEEDGGLERIAMLAAAGADTNAAGEAEVEYTTTGPIEQEIEFSVKNLAPATTFTFIIDGTDVASAITDRNGRAEVELTVPMPGRQ
jgi:hypothetical protein